MVRFSVFNELSLPLNQYQVISSFGYFFGLLAELKKLGLTQIRMSNDFKSYRILENTSFQKFVGQQSDRDFKTRLKSFVNNAVIEVNTPIIKDDDSEQIDQLHSCEYFYKQNSTSSGLACSDIWNTLAISFKSDAQWNKAHIAIRKTEIITDTLIENNIEIKHASISGHLDNHQAFFQRLESENKLNITQGNFWVNKNENFPQILKFCPEIEAQIKSLDKNIFQHAISILRDIETSQKSITDFNTSGEGETVCNTPKLKDMRMFTIEGEKVFFQKHIKSLSNGYRIYFLENNTRIYIGYIGKHLPTKNF